MPRITLNITQTARYTTRKKSIFLSQKINYKKGLAYGLLQAGHVYYFTGNFKSAKKNFENAIPLLKLLNDKMGLGTCYMLYGRLYNLYGDQSLAKGYFNQALYLFQQINNETKIAECYKNIGNSYYSEGKLSTALEFYYKALFIEIEQNNQLEIPGDYNDIGNVFQDMEAYPTALDNFKKALKSFEYNNDRVGIETVLENIGEIIYYQNNYKDAIKYLEKSLEIAKAQDDKEGICLVYCDIGLCLEKVGAHAKSINYLEKSLQTATDFNIGNCEANTNVGFATVYNLQKKFDKALSYALRGQFLANKLGNLRVRVNAALQITTALAGLNKFERAFKVLNLYNRLKDSLQSNLNLEKLTSDQLQLDFGLKKHQFQLQQKEKDELYRQKIERQWLIISISLLVVLALATVSLVYYRQRRKQQEINAMLEYKNREVLDQKYGLNEQSQKLNNLNLLKDRLISILAHDLRAPLSTLRGLFGLLQDETISYTEMLQMIPEVLKKLEYTSDFLDTLLFWINSQMENFEDAVKEFKIKEIVALETGPYQEQAALKGINLINNVPEGLSVYADPNSIRIVIRNLITNAIKFSKENDRIEINARAYNEKDQIITVSDTGAGMSDYQLNKIFKTKVNSKTGTGNETGTGMGLLFCKDLVEKCNGKIWADSKQGEGTKFSFTLPAGPVN